VAEVCDPIVIYFVGIFTCCFLFKVLPVVADVRDPIAIKTAVDKCVAEFGLPNIVINNAAGNFIEECRNCLPCPASINLLPISSDTKADPFNTISMTVFHALGDNLSDGEIKFPKHLHVWKVLY
jgi:hypothetical protein